jgi:3D-(3,5/4)-trihydroxycyclohexane-1,2-dione acylhydrolase (decyclizing)
MEKTIRLTVGQAVALFLQNQWSERDGVEQRLIPKACGIYGHGNLSGLGQGFMECGGEIEFHQPFHEQSMMHMAVGFARAKRRLSTMACTASIGPGTANMYTGAAGATITKVPVLLLPSDHYGTRRQGIVMQQLEHGIEYDFSIADGLRPVSVFFDKIVRPEQLTASLMEAARVLTSPDEAGAVTVSMCQGVQSEAGDFPVKLFEKRVWHVDRRPPADSQVARVVRLLKNAKKPLIISGGGVYYSEAEAALRDFADTFGIPVVETIAGRSTMGDALPMAAGGLGVAGNFAANHLAEHTDLVIAIGTRMLDVTSCAQTAFQNPDVRFASINILGKDAFKFAAEPILADAREGILKLAEAAEEIGVTQNKQWITEVGKAKKDWADLVSPTLIVKEGNQMTQAQALKIINEIIPENSYVVAVAGSLPGDVHKLWDTRGDKKCHLDFGYSCMTYEIPGGIGLSMAGEKNVFVCIGDGTYLMNPSDLIVAVREKINMTVCLFVNHGYQIIRALQVMTTGTEFDVEFREQQGQGEKKGDFLHIDFAKHAESLGAKVHKASTGETLRLSLDRAKNEDGPSVVVIEVDPYEMSVGTKNSFWDIAPAMTSEDPEVRELRRSYEEHRDGLQKYYL